MTAGVAMVLSSNVRTTPICIELVMSPMYKLSAMQSCATLRNFSAAGAEFNLSAASSMPCILGNAAKREERNQKLAAGGNAGAMQSQTESQLRNQSQVQSRRARKKAMYNGKILMQSERPAASNVGRFQSHRKSAPKPVFFSMFQAILDCTPTALSAHAIGGGVSL